MVKGLRVVFSPNPASRALYSYRVPDLGARGTVTAGWTAAGLRTYLAGPGGGLVYVRWDGDGLVCGVSMRDVKLEPAEGRAAPLTSPDFQI
jgi:hypothetical protein